MFEAVDSLSPELVWGVFSRGLGLIFLISFASLSGQIVPGAGRDGGMPIAMRLSRIARDFGLGRLLRFPTLLWLSSSDWMLRALVAVGLLSSALVIYGGDLSFWALLTCYLCYLSLDMAMGLIFPWDCLLFEAAILGLFLPDTLPLPALAATAAPAPAIAWAYRILVFRLMFGFGKQKFMGATLKDLSYLRGFLIAQPLPNALGWYAQKLPLWLLQVQVVFMFLAEIPVPLFALFPGDLSIICALCTSLLMLGIIAFGSFGYFSPLTIVACLPLLDNVTPLQLQLSGLFDAGAPLVANAFVLTHTLGGLAVLPFNSWVGQSWHLWSSWYRLPKLLQLPFDFFRFMHPLRWLHPYGVFPPNTGPGVKVSLLVEVSWDGEKWHELRFRYSPSNEHDPPRFVAPHHPRGDQAIIYETFGLNPTSLISGMVGPWDPYSFGTQPAANTLVQRIVEGRGRDFMQPGVLAEHDTPPQQVRISTVMLDPVSLEERRQTGKWWTRTRIGPHTPAHGSDPRYWQEFLPEPELWHPEAVYWRRQSKLGPWMRRAAKGGDAMALCLQACDGELTEQDVDRFWDEVVPMLAEHRTTFDTLPELVADYRDRYDRPSQRRLARVHGRLCLLLLARLEPLYLDRWQSEAMPAKTYLHLWMLASHVIGDGRDAYLAAFADPASLRARIAEVTPCTGLYFLSVFRYESMVFEAQKLRLLTAIMPPHDPEQKARISFSYQEMNDFERFVAQLAERFAGFFSVMPTIRAHFQGPRFNPGQPERYPVFEELPTGEVVLRDDRAEPAAAVPDGAP